MKLLRNTLNMLFLQPGSMQGSGSHHMTENPVPGLDTHQNRSPKYNSVHLQQKVTDTTQKSALYTVHALQSVVLQYLLYRLFLYSHMGQWRPHCRAEENYQGLLKSTCRYLEKAIKNNYSSMVFYTQPLMYMQLQTQYNLYLLL